jgi:predicted glycoside hydrolase/deacetylase ChbG (UPF0249 family)
MAGRTLIINADDFGLNHNVNTAIVQAFEGGYCSSATIMPNMPGFEEACELVRTHGLADHVGLHVVLTEGYPLTEDVNALRRFCAADGRFQLSRRQRVIRLTTKEREALRTEMKGQIVKCRSHGIPITHMDSHSHAHEEWAIVGVMIQVAHEEGVPRVRRTRSFGSGIVRRIYRQMVDLRLQRAGLAKTDYFGVPADYAWYLQGLDACGETTGSWELMLHPAFDDQGRLIDSWLREPLDTVIQKIPGYRAAVSYTGHRYSPKEQQVL